MIDRSDNSVDPANPAGPAEPKVPTDPPRSSARNGDRAPAAPMGSAESGPREFRPGPLVLAWLWPGLGHIVAGERARGVRIMGGLLLLIVSGLLIGGVDSVDRREDGLWFLPQAGCGPLVFGLDAANSALLKSGRVGTLHPVPESGVAAAGSLARTVSSKRGLAHPNEFGTLFIALAGLLNVVVMLDAGFRRPPSEGRR